MTLIIYLLLLTTSFLTLFISNIFLMWILLEMSSMYFIPMLNKNFKILSIMYFIMSYLSSSLILIKFLFFNLPSSSMLLIFSLWMKLGLFPLNSWMNLFMQSINYSLLLPLMTIMKIIPMIMFTTLIKINLITIMIFTLLILPPTIMSFNTTSFPMLLNYSSMYNIPMIFSISYFNQELMLWYMYMYMLFTISIMMILNSRKIYFKNSMNFTIQNTLPMTLMMFIYAQIPPFFTFSMKWILIESLMNFSPSMFIYSLIIIISSVIMTFNYLNFNTSSYLAPSSKINHSTILNTTSFHMLLFYIFLINILFMFLYSIL